MDAECERCLALGTSCEVCALEAYVRRQFAEMRRVDAGLGLELDEEEAMSTPEEEEEA